MTLIEFTLLACVFAVAGILCVGLMLAHVYGDLRRETGGVE